MKRDLQHIDDLFKAGLEGQDDTPSDQVWDAIEKELDKSAAISLQKKYARLRQVAAVLLVLLMGVSLYALRNNIFPKKSANTETTKPGTEQNIQHTLPPATNSDQAASENGLAGRKIPVKDIPNHGASGQDHLAPNQDNPTGHDEDANGQASLPSKGKALLITKKSTVSHPDGLVANVNTTKVSEPDANAAKAKNHSGEASGLALNTGSSKPTRSKDNLQAKGGTGMNGKNSDAGKRYTGGRTGSAQTAVQAQKLLPESYVEISQALVHETAYPDYVRSVGGDIKAGNTDRLSTAHQYVLPLPAGAEASAAPATIPVMNKKSGKLELPRLSLVPMFSMGSSSRQINDNPDHAYGQDRMRKDFENNEELKPTINAGLLAELRLAPRITVQSGLSFTQQTIDIEPKAIRAVKDRDGAVKYKFDCSAGTYFFNPKAGTTPTIGDTVYTKYSENRLRYLNIPLTVAYHFGNRKFSVAPMAGAEVNILINQKLQTGLQHAYYKQDPPKTTNLNKTGFTGMVGAAMDVSLNKRIALRVMPSYRFALTPMNENMPVKVYPKSVNISAGLRIGLGK